MISVSRSSAPSSLHSPPFHIPSSHPLILSSSFSPIHHLPIFFSFLFSIIAFASAKPPPSSINTPHQPLPSKPTKHYQKVMLTSFLKPLRVAVILGSARANSLNSSKESWPSPLVSSVSKALSAKRVAISSLNSFRSSMLSS